MLLQTPDLKGLKQMKLETPRALGLTHSGLVT